jgi:hypothetical protein
MDKSIELPIYEKPIPSNIVEISTLKYIINILRVKKIDIKRCVLDAGYFKDDSLDYLDSVKIDYLIRI